MFMLRIMALVGLLVLASVLFVWLLPVFIYLLMTAVFLFIGFRIGMFFVKLSLVYMLSKRY